MTLSSFFYTKAIRFQKKKKKTRKKNKLLISFVIDLGDNYKRDVQESIY